VTATTGYRVQRPLTPAEMRSVMAAIDAASSVPGIVAAVLDAVFTALLEPLGQSLADYSPGRRLDPGAFAIPFTQWAAISEACVGRADAFGGRAHVAMELINVMPASYDDPSAAVPDTPPRDQRPYEQVITASREATDVIAAASRHCADLARYYGEDSREYREAVRSWHQQLSGLFSMSFGARTRISRDGDLSLFVSTDSGFVYGIIFHRDLRRCTADGCKAMINDDGTAWTPFPDDPRCLNGQHVPSYPLDAPHPGTWSFHS
jgi:hypothetical protein